MNFSMQTAILKCNDDQQDWVECLDSMPFFSLQYWTGKYRHVSSDDDVWSWVHMMSFQMVWMVEVPIETPAEETGYSVLDAIQAITTIQDHMHDKAVNDIKWGQVQQVYNFDKQHNVTPLEIRVKSNEGVMKNITTWEEDMNPNC